MNEFTWKKETSMDAILYDEPNNNENDYTDLRPISTNNREYAELTNNTGSDQNGTHVSQYTDLRSVSENYTKYDDLNSGKVAVSAKSHALGKKYCIIFIVSIALTGLLASGVTFLAVHFVHKENSKSVCDSFDCGMVQCLVDAENNPVCIDAEIWAGDFKNISEYFPEIGAECPVGWLMDRTFCYKEFIDRRTWYQSRDFCRSIGTELVSILDKEESDFLERRLSQGLLHWIGLNKFQDGVHFGWNDGSSLNFTNWSPNEPNNFNNNEYCVQLYPGSPRLWNDNNCFISSRFVCKTKKMPNCGPGSWLFYNNSCYMFVRDEAVSWEEARNRCKNVSADLLIVDSRDEANFIRSQTTKIVPSNDLWIGLTDLENTGEYKWIDGSLPTVVSWGAGDPNNPSHNCVEIAIYYGAWNDVSCSDKKGFICEKNLFKR